MRVTSHNIFIHSASLAFGRPELSPAMLACSDQLNNHMLNLCRTLPASRQAEALMFLMQYAKLQLGEPFDFFRNYHTPAWSVIFHLGEVMRGQGCHSAGPAQLDVIQSHALRAQAYAMFLHSLDDHIVDGDISPTHLILLLRSQAWLLYKESLEALALDVQGGAEVIDQYINNYYEGMREGETLLKALTPDPSPGSEAWKGEGDYLEDDGRGFFLFGKEKSPVTPQLSTFNFSLSTNSPTQSRMNLEAYCDLFRKQMATWVIVPVLLACRIDITQRNWGLNAVKALTPDPSPSSEAWKGEGDYLENDGRGSFLFGKDLSLSPPQHSTFNFSLSTSSLQSSYESFGIAWRLLDDLNDIREDIASGTRTAVYAALGPRGRQIIDSCASATGIADDETMRTLAGIMHDENIIETITGRILKELDNAGYAAEACGLSLLAQEFASLAAPLRRTDA